MTCSNFYSGWAIETETSILFRSCATDNAKEEQTVAKKSLSSVKPIVGTSTLVISIVGASRLLVRDTRSVNYALRRHNFGNVHSAPPTHSCRVSCEKAVVSFAREKAKAWPVEKAESPSLPIIDRTRAATLPTEIL